MAALEIVSGARAGEVVELTVAETIIGRHPSCQVVLPLHTISRRHTLIRQVQGQFFIQDLDSLNGTYVNGQRLAGTQPLAHRDVIQLYDVVMIFLSQPRDDEHSTLGADADLALHLLEDDTTNPPTPQEVLSASHVAHSSHVNVGAEVKLAAVLEIARSLGGALDIGQVLPKILDNLFYVFPQASRAYILLADEATGQLVTRATKRRDRKDTFGPVSRTIAQRVMAQREAILSGDVPGDERLKGSDSLAELHVRSMMCAPLIGPSQRPLGIIHVETNNPVQRFERDDLDVLVTIATVAGQAIEYARVHNAQLRLDRKEREMAMARDVQLHFLPQRRPQVPGYRFFHYYQPAQEVGGDYYGYVPLPQGRLAVAVGDVSGKGVPAALLMARLCSDVRACLTESAAPAEALTRLGQEHLEPLLGGRFVTLAIVVLDPLRHELTMVNAGHPAPLVRRAATRDVVELGVDYKGLPLGFSARQPYEQCTTRLEPGDMVLMATDGLSDAHNAAEELYGWERVRDMLANGPGDVELLGEVLLQHVEGFVKDQPQSDDMCLVCFGRQRMA
jgi:serine phosphatase RsbU (regulator of sigma subunit)